MSVLLIGVWDLRGLLCGGVERMVEEVDEEEEGFVFGFGFGIE